MLQKFVRIIGGDPNKREVDKLSELVDRINDLEAACESLSDEQLRLKTDEFRKRLSDGETLDDILVEAFAVVREASKRTIGLRHYDVQLMGGIALHQGKIAEMRTGEGKTLVATLPLYLNALEGKGAHLVTVNDYLARRDARWMAPIYMALGLNVGVLQMAARTENGKKAFLVDLDRTSPHEDQHQLQLVDRVQAYLADITYGTNSEFGFDYLRDNLTMSLDDRVQRGHHFAIVDEVDNILIDEARTPLIISGPAQDDAEWYIRTAQVIKQLKPEDYEISERDRTVTLTEAGETHIEELLQQPLRDPERPEDITPEQARLLGFIEQGLRAQFLYRRNKDYLVQAGKVVIIDEFTGRLMPGRRWSDGLHQAVEAKEGVRVEAENITYATITLQNYFRMYKKLSGMTGTALTEAEEFQKIYKLEVLPVPTNLEYQAMRPESPLVMVEKRDEDGYKFTAYARRGDPLQTPIYWKRKDYPDVVYRTEEAKLRAITEEIVRYYVQGRPLLVGTTSVEHSDLLSNRLRAEPIRRLTQVLLLRHVWFEQNPGQNDGRAIPALQLLNKSLDELSPQDLRSLARTLDLSLNPEEPTNVRRLLRIFNLKPEDEPRLQMVLQGGVSHQVLNARKHAEESQIIAKAGAFGAVTIATNMAGRGVDIKLGGELAEEILSAVNRVLSKAGYKDPYEMTMAERREAITKLNPVDYGIYEVEVNSFMQYMDDMERVRTLGGLHIIGSERHEARRIDNQLRGRAARQGDPGSSRFYLSLEDELMRIFGGGQVNDLMQRLKIDDAIPIEHGIVGRIIEQSQTRVEGANFDIRKHLIEYDDVLNAQRARIYSQRERIFTKEDLHDDVVEMLRTEIAQRIPAALKDEEGPWKLLAWLDQIQPFIDYEGAIYPTYTIKRLLNSLEERIKDKPRTLPVIKTALLDLAESALKAEQEHTLHAVRALLERTEDSLQTQLAERREALDTYLEGLEDQDENESPRRPQEIIEEIIGLVHVPIKLSSDQARLLTSDPRQVAETIVDQIDDFLTGLAVIRVIGALERRLEESLGVKSSDLQGDDWATIADQLYGAVEDIFNNRLEKLLGEQGQITRDLQAELERLDLATLDQSQFTRLLHTMSIGSRIVFDRRTHRQAWARTTRLRYIYAAARHLEAQSPQDVADAVLNHLEEAQAIIRWIWGQNELTRLSQVIQCMNDGDAATKSLFEGILGAEHFSEIAAVPLPDLSDDDKRTLIDGLGQRVLTAIYRQLLLNVISELWVDYLTRVEALRVSIGLEAYAQRDPLVQYKSRASEMFQNLLADIRIGVISRMFTYAPRRSQAQQTTEVSREDTINVRPKEPEQIQQKKKRRRH